jgi:hypothetical protein
MAVYRFHYLQGNASIRTAWLRMKNSDEEFIILDAVGRLVHMVELALGVRWAVAAILEEGQAGFLYEYEARRLHTFQV